MHCNYSSSQHTPHRIATCKIEGTLFAPYSRVLFHPRNRAVVLFRFPSTLLVLRPVVPRPRRYLMPQSHITKSCSSPAAVISVLTEPMRESEQRGQGRGRDDEACGFVPRFLGLLAVALLGAVKETAGDKVP